MLDIASLSLLILSLWPHIAGPAWRNAFSGGVALTKMVRYPAWYFTLTHTIRSMLHFATSHNYCAIPHKKSFASESCLGSKGSGSRQPGRQNLGVVWEQALIVYEQQQQQRLVGIRLWRVRSCGRKMKCYVIRQGLSFTPKTVQTAKDSHGIIFQLHKQNFRNFQINFKMQIQKFGFFKLLSVSVILGVVLWN